VNLFQDAANATVRIECGESRGSGYHFVWPDILVTNAHVISAHVADGVPVAAVTDSGDFINMALISSSPEDRDDFAVFQVDGSVPDGRHVLQPRVP
jgi:hypothetical protein